MNDYINNIGVESVSNRQRRYCVTERTNELTRSQITSNINLLIQWTGCVNLLIQLNEPILTYSNITHTFEKKAKREQLIRVTMCDGCGERAPRNWHACDRGSSSAGSTGSGTANSTLLGP